MSGRTTVWDLCPDLKSQLWVGLLNSYAKRTWCETMTLFSPLSYPTNQN